MEQVNKSEILNLAKKHCCNWINNICIGGVFYRNDDSFHMYIDENLAGKPCVAHKKCNFYEHVVVKGI